MTSFLYGKRDSGTGKVYKGMWITPVARPLPERTDVLFVRPRDGTTTAGQDAFALGDWILYVAMRSRAKQDFDDVHRERAKKAQAPLKASRGK